MCFQVNAASYIPIICQLTTLPEFIEFVTFMARLISPTAAEFQSVLFSIYGVWNLDLFRPLLPNLCLSVGVTTLDAFAL